MEDYGFCSLWILTKKKQIKSSHWIKNPRDPDVHSQKRSYVLQLKVEFCPDLAPHLIESNITKKNTVESLRFWIFFSLSLEVLAGWPDYFEKSIILYNV